MARRLSVRNVALLRSLVNSNGAGHVSTTPFGAVSEIASGSTGCGPGPRAFHCSRAFAAEAAKAENDKEITADILTPYKTHRIEAPPMQCETTAEEALSMFRMMNVIRRAEISADMLYKQQLVRGFCHLYDGQEAVAVGMEAALNFDDGVLTAYRDHGNFLARGGTPYALFCELMGRKPGPANGKGGSMHLYVRENGFYGGWGIVGTSGPLGSGIGLGLKYEKKKNVAAVIFGDGAANQGQMYEAFNMAALWKLPTIYIIENNHYGMGTSEKRASAQTTFYDRLTFIPGIKVDGMDVFGVKQAVKFAKDYVLENGPIFLEMDTYRYHGHSMSDPGSSYRDRSEIQDMRHSRDCITRLRQFILEQEVATEDDLKAIEKEVRAQVQEDAKKAQDAPFPDTEELWSEIYRQDEGITFPGINRRETQKQMP